MADVLFVTPNFYADYLEIPLGSLLLATILRNNGIDTELVQFAQMGDPKNYDSFLQNAAKMILERKPKVVSFYTRCNAYHVVLMVAQRIKEQAPDTYILFGGPKSDIVAKETVRSFRFVDFVCCGEGENTIVPFVRSLLNGEPALDTMGLVYMDGDCVVENPRPALIENLDVLPNIDYSLVDIKAKDLNLSHNQFPVDVGRGCPFGCTFCSTKTFWGRKYRLKSPERIVQEIQRIHDQLGFTFFVFEHDMFTMNRKQVMETCQLLKTLTFPIQWRCSARIDCLDKELIDTMVQAGMRNIFIGLETGSPRMQKLINKNLDVDSVMPMLNYIHEKGVKVTTSLIYGFPEETKEDLLQTIVLMENILKLENSELIASLCVFFPGTELTIKYQNQMTPCFIISNATGPEGVRENWDFICAHRDIFQEYMEVYTPLREEMKQFTNFMLLFRNRRLVYEPLLQAFDGSLYRMYKAFLKVNSDRTMTYHDFVREDRFPESVSNVPEHDLIADVCRFWRMELETKPGMTMTDVFSFYPGPNGKIKTLADLQRGKYILTITRTENHMTKIIKGVK